MLTNSTYKIRFVDTIDVFSLRVANLRILRRAREGIQTPIVAEEIRGVLHLFSGVALYHAALGHEIVAEVVGAFNVIVRDRLTDTILNDFAVVRICRYFPETLLDLERVETRQTEIGRWRIITERMSRNQVRRILCRDVLQSGSVHLDSD